MQKKTIIQRVLVSLALGMLIGLGLSEITFIFLRETAREPKSVEIIIPAGTSELVARGKQPPAIPADMVFVVGDVLVVRNEDDVDHQLGPLWIPAGASGQLRLSQSESLVYECSFQPGNYIGLDVREPLTLATRLYGILYAGLPLGILIALYALILPEKKKVKNDPAKDVQP